jgi:hypothetical protein
MRYVVLALSFAVTGSALAEPASPQASPQIGKIVAGVFCAPLEKLRHDAPGTDAGWMHLVDQIEFHWPGRQVVPVAKGLAFGVKVRLVPGAVDATTKIRLYHPGRTKPEVWDTTFNEWTDEIDFVRFDRESREDIGTWRIEAWEGDARIYTVEFEAVHRDELPEIAEACTAVS